MPPNRNYLPNRPIFIGKTVIRFSSATAYRTLLDDIAVLHMQISGDIMLDELEPEAGHLTANTVSAHNELNRLYKLRATLAMQFRKEFIGGADPQWHAAYPLALFYVHLNRGVCSLPVIMFHFTEDVWPLFAKDVDSSAADWNSATDKLASTKLEYSRRVLITLEDYAAWSERKKCDLHSVEAKARFLLRTINQATADELSGRSATLYRPDPNTPVPEHLHRPKAKGFNSSVRPDPTLGPIYMTAMRYIIEGKASFRPFATPPRFEVLQRPGEKTSANAKTTQKKSSATSRK